MGGQMGERFDVVIVGGGNAAFSAAHAAREKVERVLILEKAPKEWAGGNSYFTAGAYRTTFEGLEDIEPLLDNADEALLERTKLDPYTPDDFMADMVRVTEGECDRTLTSVLVHDAGDTIRWLREKGLRFRLMYDRQSFEVNGKRYFWGGPVFGKIDGGRGLMEKPPEGAAGSGIEVRYESPVVDLIQDEDGSVAGVVFETSEGREEIRAGAVVLAAGGFESDEEMRAEHLGEEWREAKVRGTPHNTGDVLRMALEIGARPYGQWRGCHSVAWDAGAPPFGDLELTNLLTKQSYPLSIVVNREGKRFIDEGADYRNYTYAKYGAEILRQPGALAYQLFDAKTSHLLRQDEYTARGGHRAAQVELGTPAGRTSFLRLRSHLRHNIHLRRTAYRLEQPGAEYRRRSYPRTARRRRAGWRPLLPQLSWRQRLNGGVRLWAPGGECRRGGRRGSAR